MNKSNQKTVKIPDSIYKNRYIISAIVLIGILMSVLDGYMVSIALPTITTHFSVSVAQSQWIITGYLVVMTGLFIFFGKLSEYAGKVKLFMIGWAIFTLSSLACGFATGINELIISRIIQAIGASMVAGVSGAIIFHAFPPNEIGKAMGYFGATVALGSLIGPGLGGFITSYIGWQYIFLVNVPIGVLLLVCSLKYLKIPEIISENFQIDWIGAGTFILTVASLMLFFGELAKSTAITENNLIFGVIFLFSLIIFILQELRCKNPMLDLRIFSDKKFSFPILSALIFSIAINMSIVIGPFYFQGVMGYNSSKVGLLFMLVPLTMMFAAPLGGKFYDKHHWKYAAGLGAFILGISFILIGYAYLIMNLSLIIASLLLWGIGSGLFTSPNSTETMSALPREKTAIASSVSTTAKSMGGALGVSLTSVFLMISMNTAKYKGSILSAEKLLLTNSICSIMFIAGFLCIIAAVIAILRNIRDVPVLPETEHQIEVFELQVDEPVED